MLLGTAVTVYVGWLTRLGGPTTFDPDEHASALYFNRLVHGRQLEQIVFSTPKPLLTLVHGLGSPYIVAPPRPGEPFYCAYLAELRFA
jgi:hypothetical protein